jgi:hypothetical protein
MNALAHRLPVAFGVLLLPLCSACSHDGAGGRLRDDLRTIAPSGVALVVQAAECESRESELRVLAGEIPNLPIVFLDPRASDGRSGMRERIESLFPAARHTRLHVERPEALLAAGVAETPALIAWADTSERLEVLTLRADLRNLRDAVRWSRARRYP